MLPSADTTEPAEPAPAAPAGNAVPTIGSVPAAQSPPWQALKQATDACRECPLGAPATQSVPGEGPLPAMLMIVGEQPEDVDDLLGRPFTGPVGRLLDDALQALGWPREALFLSNAVRHFKFEQRGKRRIAKPPAQREIDACRHWLEAEVALVQPRAFVALGRNAASALLGHPVDIEQAHGRRFIRDDGRRVLVTRHPQELLRLPPGTPRDEGWRQWLDELRLAERWLGPA